MRGVEEGVELSLSGLACSVEKLRHRVHDAI
jgi:hypothetical protein